MEISEQKYYERQVLLPELTDVGQQYLNAGSVLVVGAGGLGCPVLEYLVRAGVGRVGLVDGDSVDITNLHRQTLYNINDIGRQKAEVAAERLRNSNPFITIEPWSCMLTPENAFDIIKSYNVVVDATDNYPVRYLVNDVCVLLGKPLVYGAIYRFQGQVSVFNYMGGATYRCLFPDYPKKDSITNCSTAGVIGILPGIIGLMQANEVIKILTDSPQVISNQLLTYDAKSGQMSSIAIQKSKNFDYELLRKKHVPDHPYYSNSCKVLVEINQNELVRYFNSGKSLTFIDVRNPGEEPAFLHPDVYSAPLSSIGELNQLPESELVVVFCKSGIRSKSAIEILKDRFPKTDMVSLKGGITPDIINLWNKNK